jgi:hypothetical protein
MGVKGEEEPGLHDRVTIWKTSSRLRSTLRLQEVMATEPQNPKPVLK